MIRQTRSAFRQIIGGERIDGFRRWRDRQLELRRDPVIAEHARRLSSLQNKYAGRRCVVIGNGPSLSNTDLELTRNEITFGLNRIYLLFERLGFHTTFLVSMNRYVIEQFSHEITQTNSIKLVSDSSREHVDVTRPDLILFRTDTLQRPKFSKRPVSEGVWEGSTVTYAAMQLAFFMGFTEVILVGVDHRFESKGPAHSLVTATGPDKDHFDPTYFGGGVKWQLPDLPMSEIAYLQARQAFQRAGRRIVDATVGGELRVFPKVELSRHLASTRPPSYSRFKM